MASRRKSSKVELNKRKIGKRKLSKQKYCGVLFLLCIIIFCFLAVPCFAADIADPLFPAAPPPAISARAAVMMDEETGTILFSKNPTTVISPASLTKLMTIHLALRAIRAGKTTPDTIVELPPESWAENQPPRSSLMFLGRNQTVTLGELLLGLAVSSGNDAAVATALHLAHSIEAFTAMMNAEAGRLGLASSRFFEPAGISPENTTSAADFARFCQIYLTEHPESLALLHSVPSFAYPLAVNTGTSPSRTIVQNNRNTLLGRIDGVDGLKTGYITEAGYNIALTGRREGTRLIAVLLGASSEDERDRDGEALLNWGFANFRTLRLEINYIPQTRIWGSKEQYFSLKPGEELLTFTVSTSRAGVLQQDTELFPYLKAPLPAGKEAGTLIISDEMGELRRIPLVLEKEAPQSNFFRVLLDSIEMLFKKLLAKLP
ncbi:MAG: D-alanyl-D-alanine carboxypeptidase [Spirochaetaceae bacterium]|jgi:D-alanyl-D-alanine carboxypeptidase (penicillin-binding protein 5/6)|nr:D-alanyl-D-alanine carboxypeptidase [Spirochaetaceae bacterium]